MWVQHTHFSGAFGQRGPDQFGDLRSSLQPSAEALLPQPVKEIFLFIISVSKCREAAALDCPVNGKRLPEVN